jgi:abequosyltransferase
MLLVQLSICIATFNRDRFIGETLESITAQLQPGVEVVIVDGASSDGTAAVVAHYVERFANVRYVREDRNSGVDADYDKAVGYARGRHCWLFADDDLIAPGAIARVLEALERGTVDLLIIDAEIRDRAVVRTLKRGRLPFTGERTYGPQDAAQLLQDTGDALSFIGGVILRRDLWLSRDRERYFGSLFIHVGVIFQEPPIERVKVLAESLVMIRYGNAMWRPRSFEIWAFIWPELIWGFAGFSPMAKRQVTPLHPWKNARWLFRLRAMGGYSLAEYRTWFTDRKLGVWRIWLLAAALLPGRLANFMGVCMLGAAGSGAGEANYELVTCSRYSSRASRLLASVWLGDLAWDAA